MDRLCVDDYSLYVGREVAEERHRPTALDENVHQLNMPVVWSSLSGWRQMHVYPVPLNGCTLGTGLVKNVRST